MTFNLLYAFIGVIIGLLLLWVAHEWVVIPPMPCDCQINYVCACVNGFNCWDGCYFDNGTLIYSSANCPKSQRCVYIGGNKK